VSTHICIRYLTSQFQTPHIPLLPIAVPGEGFNCMF